MHSNECDRATPKEKLTTAGTAMTMQRYSWATALTSGRHPYRPYMGKTKQLAWHSIWWNTGTASSSAQRSAAQPRVRLLTSAQLVNLVNEDHGVACACRLEALHHFTRHGTYICPPMPCRHAHTLTSPDEICTAAAARYSNKVLQ